MHQTLYVDIDEEITSIVEKLRSVETGEAVIVAPKNASLIQSIVNLKLLRKEADGLGIKIAIVTQDKLGKRLIEKAGILFQDKLDEYDLDEENVELNELSKKNEHKKIAVLKRQQLTEDSGDNRRLDEIGSAEYFTYAEKENVSMNSNRFEEIKKDDNKSRALSGTHQKNEADYFSEEMSFPENYLPKKNISKMDVSAPVKAETPKRSGIYNFTPKGKNKNNNKLARYDFSVRGTADKKEEQLEHFFYPNNFSNKKEDEKELKEEDKKKKIEKEPKKKKGLKFLTFAFFILLVGGLGYGMYVFLPEATISIFAKKDVKSADGVISVDASQDNIDQDKMIIPGKILNFDESISETFSATGLKNVSNQKAKGKIMIYNEYSSAPQVLVATTRFLSGDQKLFRLISGVVVPGMTKVGADTKPGVVEAEVVADEAGDSYNIGPSNFSIPGFKDSNSGKYSKIYAKSVVAMAGGGNGANNSKIISDKDLSVAKDKISLDASAAIKKKIKDSVQGGTVILDDAISLGDISYSPSASAGTVTDNFEIKAQTKAVAIVFSESNIKSLAGFIVSKSNSGNVNQNSESITLDYGKVSADFKANTLSINVHISSNQTTLDAEILKKGLLGKNNNEIIDYLKNYPSIEKAEVEYWPPIFVNKIPVYEKRVKVNLNYMDS
jgi:hypothetical protein